MIVLHPHRQWDKKMIATPEQGKKRKPTLQRRNTGGPVLEKEATQKGKKRKPIYEHLRQDILEQRVLPDPEETAALGEHNSVEVEHYMAGLQRLVTAYIRGLRAHRAH